MRKEINKGGEEGNRYLHKYSILNVLEFHKGRYEKHTIILKLLKSLKWANKIDICNI